MCMTIYDIAKKGRSGGILVFIENKDVYGHAEAAEKGKNTGN